ncbi:hypothetical protein AJ79_08438 [Helicocarpus griseus UAMH5409]|uniref:Tyrosyl-DNA phosphodiesterase n=1 Tax=Helicocarpus griseus UAMH5409 TaxID=1447875 RepID=A0A2B7WT36_9EURO|nr:hypothetical protein AJ79_08438 [Helicocarpus griseus UAMH5409]
MEDNDRPSKRLKSSHEALPEGHSEPSKDASTLASMNRSITPPLRRPSGQPSTYNSPTPKEKQGNISFTLGGIPSPIQLTHIRDFPASSDNNTDTVRLRDILGDPLIKECWQFNYMFNVDFLMSQFDEDVRNLVKVKIIHGSWKKESPNRIQIDEGCRRYSNVEPIVAYMPEPFGTHHSKMMIIIRHDDQAQVVIHTANMIAGDWANMSQAVWRSPLLPMLSEKRKGHSSDAPGGIGTGKRFKRDLLAYLEAYGHKKTGPLVEQLEKYDFSSIRAALIASTPSRQAVDELDSERHTLWGWPALKDTLRHISYNKESDSGAKRPQIVIQISSVATLGQTNKWLKETFFDALSPPSVRSSGLLKAQPNPPAKFSIIFPTPDEIRRSLNGYASGGSIHMKLQSVAQQKQLQYLRPYLCRWAGDTSDDRSTSTKSPSSGQTPLANKVEGEFPQEPTEPTLTKECTHQIREAGRRRAAPHIKTYVRFSDADMATIDWAMVTSANLSLQAWGAGTNGKKEIRICSWEIGVLVWPELFASEEGSSGEHPVKEKIKDDSQGASGSKNIDDKRTTVMVPCFKRDAPEAGSDRSGSSPTTSVGLRMPYDLPLTPYNSQDQPWCATAAYSEPDWLGQTWEEQ